MNERMVTLLKNAAKCFDKSYSPFCHEELLKMNVTADECLDLSATISSIITEYIADGTPPFTIMDYVVSLMKTQKQMSKTSKVVASFDLDYVKMPEAILKLAVKKTDMIKEDFGFIMNFVRLDVLRQITDREPEKEKE